MQNFFTVLFIFFVTASLFANSEWRLLYANNYVALDHEISLAAADLDQAEIINSGSFLTVLIPLHEDYVPADAYLEVGTPLRVINAKAEYRDVVAMEVVGLFELQLHDTQYFELSKLSAGDFKVAVLDLVQQYWSMAAGLFLALNVPQGFAGMFITDRSQQASRVELKSKIDHQEASEFIYQQLGSEVQVGYQEEHPEQKTMRWIDDEATTQVELTLIPDTHYQLFSVTSGTECGDELAVFSYSLFDNQGEELKEIGVFDIAITHVFRTDNRLFFYAENPISRLLYEFKDNQLTLASQTTIASMACGC